MKAVFLDRNTLSERIDVDSTALEAGGHRYCKQGKNR